MGTNKKTILISWLIGVGFGLFFSGIILSILLYTSNKVEVSPAEGQEQVQEVGDEEPDTPGETEEVEETPGVPEPTNEENEVNQNNADNQEETIELNIEQSATAKEITRMLVDNNVISDYDEFIAYIVSQDAERTLSHGKKIFPLNSDIETVFKVLRPYK